MNRPPISQKSQEQKVSSQAIILANIVFSCTILFFTFLLVYGIINFSRFKFVYVIGIYSGTVAGIIAMLFAYRLRPLLRLKIALMIVSVFLAIYGTEAILPIDPLVPLPNFRIFEEKGFPRLYDKRTRLQVIKALGREGIKAYPSLSCALWGNNAYQELAALYPLAGISNVTTVMDNESGKRQIFESDEHGFNNPKELYVSDTLQIAVLGDSLIYGGAVAREENVVGWLRGVYPKSINLGLFGIGPLAELAIFREYVQPLRPKVVLWAFFDGNDIGNLETEMNDAVLSGYLDSAYSNRLIRRQKEINTALINWIEWRMKEIENPKSPLKKEQLVEKWRKTFTLARLRLLLGLQADKKDFIIPCPPFCHKLHKFNPLEPKISYTLRKILNEANQNTKSWGGQFYFVYLPSYNSVRTNLPDDYTLSLVRELNISVINMLPIFTALSDPLSIFFFRRPGTHYNADGHKLVADTILKSISVRDN